MKIEDLCLYILDFHDKYLFEIDSTLKKYSYVFLKEDILMALQKLISNSFVKTIDARHGIDVNIISLLDCDISSIIFDLTQKGKNKAKKIKSIEHRRQDNRKYQSIRELEYDLIKYNEINIFIEVNGSISNSYILRKKGDNVEIIYYYTSECKEILPIKDIGNFLIRDKTLSSIISKFTVWYKV